MRTQKVNLKETTALVETSATKAPKRTRTTKSPGKKPVPQEEAALVETVAKETQQLIENEAAASDSSITKEAEVHTDKLAKDTKERAVKKQAAKKVPVKETIYLQYLGREIDAEDIKKKVKEKWTKELKNKVSDIKSITLYLKPEENAAYYVINGEITGNVIL